jgi:hypothetical protein
MSTRAVFVLSLCATVMLAGCATVRTHRALQDFLAEFPVKREAWAAARARLRQMCEAGASACAPRWVRVSATEVSRWEQRAMPPYEVIVAVHEEEDRARRTLWLADEYVVAVVRGIAVQADAGQVSDEDAMRLVDHAFAQAAQALRREWWSLHQSYLLSQQRDQETLTAFLNTFLIVAAAGLNAYAATLPPPIVVVPPPRRPQPITTSVDPAVRRDLEAQWAVRTGGATGGAMNQYIRDALKQRTSELPPVLFGCTDRLNALHGLMLCMASDGRVVAR